MLRISEQIAEWLAQQGIEQVFSVTGGGSMFLNQALGSHPKLKCTFMHHEQACAMAAEGYARIAGKPAVVMLTTGPGSINAMNGVYGAYTDSIPMIVISGQVKRETCLSFYDLPNLRQLGDQEGPTIAMVSPICKYAELIRSPEDIIQCLPRAYLQATTGRPGPVWLDIPLDIQSSTEQLNIPPAKAIAYRPTVAIESGCLAIIARLKQSHRPIIIGGTGVRLSNTVDRLRQLVERLGIPLATAWTHDLIESNHPLCAGRPGTIGTRFGNFSLQNSDFVLVLGSRLNIRQTSYNWDSFAKNAWLAQVDIDAAELKKPTIKVDYSIESDLEYFLNVFESLISKEKIPNFGGWVEWCQNIKQKYTVKNEHQQIINGPLNPYLVVDRIFENMREDDIVACGNASACILPFQIGNLKRSQRLFSNSGSASMGYDLPAALGAASAANNIAKQRVICFAGDGSLQMNIQELQTLKTSQLNVIIIVLNNGGYLSIWQTHENFFGRVIGATPTSGVEFPDFSAVANAYGIEAHTINTESDLINMDSLLQKNGPLLLNIIVDSRQEFTPRVKSRVDANGRFITPELDDMHPFINNDVIKNIREKALLIKHI
jgi:acetolactate synthase I/II/III large subunit